MRLRPSLQMFGAVFVAGFLGASLCSTPSGLAVTKKKPAAAGAVATSGGTSAAKSSASQGVVRSGSMLDVKRDLLGGRPVLRQVSLASVGGEQAAIVGGRPVSYAQLADASLLGSRQRRDRLVGGRGGMLNDPVMTEELVETDLAAILVSTTSFTVVDPAAVRSSAPEVMRRSATGVTAAQLNPTQRKAFEAFKASIGAKPNGHPLKEALAKGEDALITALAEGKGDQTITTRVRFEKQSPAVKGLTTAQIRSGPIAAPSKTAAGSLAVGKPVGSNAAGTANAARTASKSSKSGTAKAGSKRKSALRAGPMAGMLSTLFAAVPKVGSSKVGSPKESKVASAAQAIASPTTSPKVAATTTAAPRVVSTCCDQSDSVSLLAGFTIGDDLGWSETINLGIGEFTVGAAAEYSVGLRIPMKVSAVLTPSVMANTNDNRGDHTYEAALSAETFDGNADYYRSVGLSENDVQDGKELVVLGDVYVFIEGNVLGLPFDGRFPDKPLLDFGQNFVPPYGNCGAACGFDIWIPAVLTHTNINIAGIASGSGQIGFNISGAGTVAVDYESLVDGKVVPSSSGAGAAVSKNRWSSDGVGFSPKMKTDIALAESSTEKSFGYKFSNPSYTWDIVATPQVKAEAGFNLLLFKDDFTFGPYTIGALSFGLGSLELGAHAGTPDSFTNNAGQYVQSGCAVGAKVGCTGGSLQAQNSPAAEPIETPLANVGDNQTKSTVGQGYGVAAPTTTIRKRKAGAGAVSVAALSPATSSPGANTPTTIKVRAGVGGNVTPRKRKAA